MSPSDARPMPRLFVARHGETEWSLNGFDANIITKRTQFPTFSQETLQTGITDIPLTARGEDQARKTAANLIGEGRLIDPKNLCTVYVSPRQRAHRTFHLFFEEVGQTPDHILTEEIREWDYGEFEGLLTKEIHARQPGWNAWRDGFPGGESAAEMEFRVDRVIDKIREHHRQYVEEGSVSRDVMIVAHGHFGRCLVARWVGVPLAYGTKLTMDAGSISILGYNHDTLAEPSIVSLNISATLL